MKIIDKVSGFFGDLHRKVKVFGVAEKIFWEIGRQQVVNSLLREELAELKKKVQFLSNVKSNKSVVNKKIKSLRENVDEEIDYLKESVKILRYADRGDIERIKKEMDIYMVKRFQELYNGQEQYNYSELMSEVRGFEDKFYLLCKKLDDLEGNAKEVRELYKLKEGSEFLKEIPKRIDAIAAYCGKLEAQIELLKSRGINNG